VLTGLFHLHRTLAYLVFLVALINVVLVLSRGRSDPKTARLISMLARFGLRMGGGLTVLLGVGLWSAGAVWPLATPWLWISLCLWAPVEILNKRMVLPETQLVVDGGQGTARMWMGAIGQLLCIAVIFGLMSARP
jgi:heme A synthase